MWEKEHFKGKKIALILLGGQREKDIDRQVEIFGGGVSCFWCAPSFLYDSSQTVFRGEVQNTGKKTQVVWISFLIKNVWVISPSLPLESNRVLKKYILLFPEAPHLPCFHFFFTYISRTQQSAAKLLNDGFNWPLDFMWIRQSVTMNKH